MLRSLALAAALLFATADALAQIPLDSEPPVRGPARTADQNAQRSTALNPAPLSTVNPLGSLLPVGPDGFGYSLTDDTEFGGPAYNFIDIEDPSFEIATGFDAAATTGLASPVLFYGSVIQSIRVSTSGYISTDLTDSGGDFTNDATLPTSPDLGGGARLYPHHDDQNTTVYSGYYPVCPRDAQAGPGYLCNIVQWEGGYGTGATGDVSYQVLIYGNGEIVFQYRTVSEGGSGATVGLQSEPGFTAPDYGIAYSANTADSVVPGRAIRVTSPNNALLVDSPNDNQAYVAGNTGSLADCGDGVQDGDCTLREAIMVANDLPGIDQVSIDVLTLGVPVQIFLTSELPAITDPRVILTGLTQDGSACGLGSPSLNAIITGQSVVGPGVDGITVAATATDVSISGLSLGDFSGSGMSILGDRARVTCNSVGVLTDNLTVAANGGAGILVQANETQIGDIAGRNIVSFNDADGIVIDGGNLNRVYNNWVGVTASGLSEVGNGANGILVTGAATNTTVGFGGSTRNVASGNGQNGILVTGVGVTGTRVEGNFAGTTANPGSLVPFPNTLDGIRIAGGATGTVVHDNLASGNTQNGIRITDDGTNGTVVTGNRAGTNQAATDVIPNSETGILVIAGADDTEVGGPFSGEGNIVSGNLVHGIQAWEPTTERTLIDNNTVGLLPDGSAAGNGQLGIVLTDATGTLIGTLAGNTVGSNAGSGIGAFGTVTNTTISNNIVGLAPDGTVRANGGDGIVLSGPTDTIIQTNVISGNTFSGVVVQGTGTDRTHISGNTIGLAPDGSVRPNGGNGVTISSGAADSIVESNVISGNTRAGVVVLSTGTDRTHIWGNIVGLAADGETPRGNGERGIYVFGGAADTIIGSNLDGTDDLLEGNRVAFNGSTLSASLSANVTVASFGTGTRIYGNKIGQTDNAILKQAGAAFGARGVQILSTPDVIIGSGQPGGSNVIGGQERAGIEARGPATTELFVTDNLIGLSENGLDPAGNLVGGIILGGGISGSEIVFNSIANNGVGILAESDAGSGNFFLANLIFDNVGLGIDLGGDGVTANDPGDTDSGPNGLQNYPDLVAAEENASGDIVDATFTLDAAVGVTYRLDFYRSPTADASGHGEGAEYLFPFTYTPAASSLQAGSQFSVSVPVPDALRGSFAPGDVISLTATPQSGSQAGSTSEFSNAVPVTLAAPYIQVLAFLEGAWDAANTAMRADITPPTSQPYSDPIYDGTPLDYDGPETASAQSLATFESVDWVLIQLRTSTEASSTVSTIAALVGKFGGVVSTSGLSSPSFPGVPAGNYYVVVLHRNHLAAMTAAPVTLPGGFADLAYSPAYGANATKDLGEGYFGLWAGDGNGDGSILADDRQSVWLPQVGQSGYLPGDFNLDGDVLADDRQSLWAPNVGRQSAVPGASLRPVPGPTTSSE